MAGVPMRMAQHSGQGRLGHINHGHGGHSHGGHAGHGVNGGHSHGRHGQMMMQPQPHQPPHQYSQAQGPVIVTMGGPQGGHMSAGSHMSPGAQGHMSAGSHMSPGAQGHMSGAQGHMSGAQGHMSGAQGHMSPGGHMSAGGHHSVHTHMAGPHHSHHGGVHHDPGFHHHHHHTAVPPPTHYQPPPPPYTTLPLSQILPPPSSSSSGSMIKEKTPMCLVNELARYNKVGHQYRLTDESGPAHKKNFTVCLKIGDREEYSASGPSIKKAQHAAAAISLEKTSFKHPSPKAKNMKNANITPTVELNALAMKRGEVTSYTFLEPAGANSNRQQQQSFSSNGFGQGQRGPGAPGVQNNQFGSSGGQRPGPGGGYPPMFCVQLRVGGRDFMGEGPTAQAAKHTAASKALKMLRDIPLPDCKSKLDPTSQPFTPGIEYDELKSPISLVHEIALKRNLQVYFEVVREAGPPHMRTFLTKVIVGDFVTEGEGNGKKVSKKRAAELMLERLKQLPPVASAMVPKPRKVVTGKKKSRNLIKVEAKEGPLVPGLHCSLPGVAGVGALPPPGLAGDCQTINPISRLIQIQQAKKEKEPVYSLIAERGMPRRREFVMQVCVTQHSTTGTGPNKKLAKRAAAESLLQLLGYSRPSVQPNKPAIKTSEVDRLEKAKKLTFVDEVGSQLEGHVTGNGTEVHVSGSTGRQLAPGLLYIDQDKNQNAAAKPNGSTGASAQINGGGGKAQMTNGNSGGNTQAATIAQELLSGGASPTADAIAKKSSSSASLPQPMPQLPTSGQGVSPKEQLAYLSQVLGFSVTYNDFPKKGEYLSLVSLSTTPPQVSHGAGSTLEGSHNSAALTALRTLANTGLDNVTGDSANSGIENTGSLNKVTMK